MKKYILLASSMLILAACGVQAVILSMFLCQFKPQVPTKVEPIDSGVSIALEPINIEQNNNYSDYFENSVLKIRIEKKLIFKTKFRRADQNHRSTKRL